ncbi:MAG: hypothetical protein WA081_08295 [Desulfosalsimonadaceae bacterium]
MRIDYNHEETKKWVDAWQKASVALNDIKKNELCDPDYYEKNRKILDGMLQYACENAKIRLSSGLVEQQRLFIKMKKINYI